MEKISLNQRDLVLVPFPFSDHSGQKIRPAVVVSNDQYNRSGDDCILCAVTSNLKLSRFSVLIQTTSLEKGTLYETSSIKVDSLLKINKVLILKVIGSINAETFSKVQDLLTALFDLSK